MKPFPLLMFSGGVILLPSLLIDIQELSAVQQNIKHERLSNLSMLYLEQHDGWWLLSLGNNLFFFLIHLGKKVWFFDSVIWGILVQEFYHKSSPPLQSSIILWQLLPLGMLLHELHELMCFTTFLNVLKMAVIQFFGWLKSVVKLVCEKGLNWKYLADWLTVALLPHPSSQPEIRSWKSGESGVLVSSYWKLVDLQVNSGFFQVYIHQADTGVLGHLRYCHTWFSSSLGHLIPT